jgi:hypothetical protein
VAQSIGPEFKPQNWKIKKSFYFPLASMVSGEKSAVMAIVLFFPWGNVFSKCCFQDFSLLFSFQKFDLPWYGLGVPAPMTGVLIIRGKFGCRDTGVKAMWRRHSQRYCQKPRNTKEPRIASYHQKEGRSIEEFFLIAFRGSMVLCWKQSMRSLWELDMSTAMSNNLKAEIGTAPSCRREQEQNAAQLLCIRTRMFTSCP